MFSFPMVHKRDPSQQTIRSSKRCKRRSIETVQTECNRCNRKQDRTTKCMEGQHHNPTCTGGLVGGGEEFKKWKAENPRLQMKQIPLQHDMLTCKIIKWETCKIREMHVPSCKHTGRAKAKHKCRCTYTVWSDVRVRCSRAFVKNERIWSNDLGSSCGFTTISHVEIVGVKCEESLTLMFLFVGCFLSKFEQRQVAPATASSQSF